MQGQKFEALSYKKGFDNITTLKEPAEGVEEVVDKKSFIWLYKRLLESVRSGLFIELDKAIKMEKHKSMYKSKSYKFGHLGVIAYNGIQNLLIKIEDSLSTPIVKNENPLFLPS